MLFKDLQWAVLAMHLFIFYSYTPYVGAISNISKLPFNHVLRCLFSALRYLLWLRWHFHYKLLFQWFITFPPNYLWGLKFSHAFLFTGQQWIYLESWKIISIATLELSELREKKWNETKPNKNQNKPETHNTIKKKKTTKKVSYFWPLTRKNRHVFSTFYNTKNPIANAGSITHLLIVIKTGQKIKIKHNEKLQTAYIHFNPNRKRCKMYLWLSDVEGPFCWLQHFDFPELCAMGPYYSINKFLWIHKPNTRRYSTNI